LTLYPPFERCGFGPPIQIFASSPVLPTFCFSCFCQSLRHSCMFYQGLSLFEPPNPKKLGRLVFSSMCVNRGLPAPTCTLFHRCGLEGLFPRAMGSQFYSPLTFFCPYPPRTQLFTPALSRGTLHTQRCPPLVLKHLMIRFFVILPSPPPPSQYDITLAFSVAETWISAGLSTDRPKIANFFEARYHPNTPPTCHQLDGVVPGSNDQPAPFTACFVASWGSLTLSFHDRVQRQFCLGPNPAVSFFLPSRQFFPPKFNVGMARPISISLLLLSLKVIDQ